MRAKLVGLLVVVAWLAIGRDARAQLMPQQDPVPFGNVVVGTPNTQTLSYLETGFLDTLGTPTLSGCGPDWQLGPVNPPPGTNLTNGQIVTVIVTFKPATRGTQSCDVFIPSGLAGNPVNNAITGTGVAPVASVAPPSGVFGPVSTGQTSAPLTITVTNTTTDAGQNLHFGTLTLTGPNAGDFTITSVNPPADLPPGASAQVTLTFHPSAGGSRGATMTIPTNDPQNPNLAVILSGTGTDQKIATNPAGFTYPPVTAGTTSDKPIAVNNTGTSGSLHVTSATIAGGSWFVFTNSPPGTPSCTNTQNCTFSPALAVAPGAAANLTVRCAPPIDTAGTQTATLNVASDTIAGGNNTTMLTCTAVKPDITISQPLMHDFGNLHVGNQTTFNMLTITNAGGAPLTYTIARSSGGSSGDFTLSGPACSGGTTCSSSLPPSATNTYAVTFTPSAQGPRSATLAITSNDQDPGDGSQTYTLSGTGTQPTLSGVPPNGATLAFGAVPVATEGAAQMVTATNTGNEDLMITSASLGGANPGDFVIKSGSTGAQTVTAGAMAAWTMACKPSVRGARAATFTVANNSANLPTFTVNLTCTGTGPNLVASPTSLPFGNVREGMSAQQTFTLTNNGEATATISAATLAPANVGYTFSGVAAGDTIAAGAFKTVTVTFAPVAGMDGGNAALTFSSNAANSPTVVSITGVGQPFGISITCPDCAGSPVTMDYGDVEWDQSRSEVFTITNTATSDVTIQGLALTETADFQLVTPPATPFVLHAGNSKTVTVAASPNDTMLGAFTGQLQVMTDLPAPMMLVTRELKVSSVSPALTVLPAMTVDFGAVDLAVGSKTITVTVENTGTGAMNITAWPALADPHFTSAAIGPVVLAPGAMQTVDVTYTPTAEGSAATPDTVDLVLTIDGLFSTGTVGPSQQKITLDGHGATRHIAVTGSPITFGPTYRNPSPADAPVQMVTVANTGEAPLTLTASLDPTSDAVFTLLDTAQITVPGGSSMPVRVRFAPTADSGTFHGTLLITDDDTGSPMQSVPITGTAVARMIGAAPATIDFGDAYEHVAVRLSDSGNALVITNNDPNLSVRVRELDVTDDADGVFSVVTQGGQTLGPGQSGSFDLAFTPDATGDFSAHVKVFFDDDTIPDATVDLTGTGIKGRGSYYACGAGRDAGGAAPIALALLVLVIRRRGRRAARPVAAAR
jgi:hypothetical protein